jgi:hypothetical protein
VEGDHPALSDVDCLAVVPLALNDDSRLLPHSPQRVVEHQHPRVAQEGLDSQQFLVGRRSNHVDDCHRLGVYQVYKLFGGGQQGAFLVL